MPHKHRFYVEPDALNADTVTLTGAEAHHAANVVRVRKGDEVACFNGRGLELTGTVESIDRATVMIAANESRKVPEPLHRVTLLQGALLREGPVEELIKRGTEIGIARFVFFRAAHSERLPTLGEKWTRWAIESCKQCGRLWLPEFEVATSLSEAILRADGNLMIATPTPAPVPLRRAVNGPRATIIVGPEGDFSAEELALAQDRRAMPVSLGPVTYRSEVAATLLAALVLYEMGALR